MSSTESKTFTRPNQSPTNILPSGAKSIAVGRRRPLMWPGADASLARGIGSFLAWKPAGTTVAATAEAASAARASARTNEDQSVFVTGDRAGDYDGLRAHI
ncbi:MAG TPA: hypothetical protein VK480_01925 [Solirubrobacterales bacterium]|nr:hypothetical protein [Solirubrobacterales bacterium]